MLHNSNIYHNEQRLTRSFLFAQPSSKAGSSTPFKSCIARKALSASSNSANPKPCGLFAGVISRLKDATGPHAYVTLRQNVRSSYLNRRLRTPRSRERKASVIPPEIEPTKSCTRRFCEGGTKDVAWCCAIPGIEGA
jgi:hypothetical protein